MGGGGDSGWAPLGAGRVLGRGEGAAGGHGAEGAEGEDGGVVGVAGRWTAASQVLGGDGGETSLECAACKWKLFFFSPSR